jgi:hypothetical protein
MAACHAVAVSDAEEAGRPPGRLLYSFGQPPSWTGPDFWLRRDSPERFADWVMERLKQESATGDRWVTIDPINACGLEPHLLRAGPTGRRLDVAATVRSLDNLLTAHVLAYQSLRRMQADAAVGLGVYALSIYEVDRLLADVLLARSAGVARYELGHWLRQRRQDHYSLIGLPERRRLLEKGLRRMAAAAFPLEQALPRAVDAIYASPVDRCLDFLLVDLRQPVASSHLRIGRAQGTAQRWSMTPPDWHPAAPSPTPWRALEGTDPEIWVAGSDHATGPMVRSLVGALPSARASGRTRLSRP